MIVDAHQHFWDRSNAFTDWPPDGLAPIDRNFLPGDYAEQQRGLGIAGTILVQAAPCEQETRWLLAQAEQMPTVLAVIGWTDLAAPDAADALAALAAQPRLRAIRPMLQDMAERDWILRPQAATGLDAMVALGLCFDALVRADQITVIARLAARHPDLRIVLDHGGKPDIASGDLSAWQEDVAALAACPNVVCKLSGLWTEAGGNLGDEAIGPVVRHLLASFGDRRLLWGSDWPVIHLAGTCADWLAQCHRLLSHLDKAALDRIFGLNAMEAYGLAPL